MTYYLDFGPEGSSIREPISFRVPTAPPYRKVPQYVIFENEPSSMAKYRARTIIKKVGDEYFNMKKTGESIGEPGRKLTADEEKELLLQIIKSLVWTRHSE